MIRRRPGWRLPDSAATPEGLFQDRRKLLAVAGGGALLAAALFVLGGDEAPPAPIEPDPSAPLYPVARNPAFTLDRPLTPEAVATSYNNFYEFGSHKRIANAAQALPLRPWQVRLDGLVEAERTLDIDDLLRLMPLEERLYRLRCVEAWAMAVPWSGFALKALVDLARPLTSARYVRMEVFQKPEVARGQSQAWYPWPYTEGLTFAEATNELAFIATGAYGKPLPKQNGAPLRLAVPWKYGFKSVKSIVRFTFTEERPVTFWQKVAPHEYGFWANVNPAVSHPRWSQAKERLIGSEEQRDTLLFNSYGDYVAELYRGLEKEPLYS